MKKNQEASSILNKIETTRFFTQANLDKFNQVDLGQYFTPLPVASLMSSMFQQIPDHVNLLDPGAGTGILTAAFVTQCLLFEHKPKIIQATLYEVDYKLITPLSDTLHSCYDLCKKNNINFSFKINNNDFIEENSRIILGRESLFSVEQPEYNISILNPPYKKILSNSKTRQQLSAIGIETTNLYSAFVWMVSKLLTDNGQMVAIIPRSFCNGTYFLNFRKEFTATMNLLRIHSYDSRDKAFSDGNVLQENVVIYAQKNSTKPRKVTISHNHDPSDENVLIQEVDYEKVIIPKDPNHFIRILPNSLGNQISDKINSLPVTLADLGISVSTGRVVDFRSRSLLRNEPDVELIPLIYPQNLRGGCVQWPIPNGKKHQFLASTSNDNLLIPSQNYVFVKRFSSKEERKRIYASVFNPDNINAPKIGVENHINILYKRYGQISLNLAKGLTAFLNSSFVDMYFRQFSGHTQINAGDLRSLKFPTEEQLISIGKKIGDNFDHQENLDNLVREELTMKNPIQFSGIDNPIFAKRKITEALQILSFISVPRSQQNDRSALTLLALANLKPKQDWSETKPELIGITEMIDFFDVNYGAKYAPNTRETVRRQTVHQFIQLGLVTENPDDPDRPINSPKTRYLLEETFAVLLRRFGSKNWNKDLNYFISTSPNLKNLTVRERNIPSIPVLLPDGEKILITSGGQNNLIKQIIEEFCPRFTPGGKVIYIGDAGNKVNDQELIAFSDLGFSIDKHGKMPDVVVNFDAKNWIVLIEAVTSHGPINLKRHNELRELFSNDKYGLVFVTAFETRKAMNKFLSEISWETEVWTAEAPEHLIHFNGNKFLGPYEP